MGRSILISRDSSINTAVWSKANRWQLEVQTILAKFICLLLKIVRATSFSSTWIWTSLLSWPQTVSNSLTRKRIQLLSFRSSLKLWTNNSNRAQGTRRSSPRQHEIRSKWSNSSTMVTNRRSAEANLSRFLKTIKHLSRSSSQSTTYKTLRQLQR